jgi:hypothetical protein
MRKGFKMINSDQMVVIVCIMAVGVVAMLKVLGAL